MVGELAYMAKNALHELAGGTRILQGDIVRNCVKFA